jgi:predicted  nucleic acid-binding Zn-ribbon protein
MFASRASAASKSNDCSMLTRLLGRIDKSRLIAAKVAVEARRPNLTEALADIKMALTDAKEELVSKDAEIEKMKKQFQRVADIVEFDGYKYDKVAHTT